MKQTRNTSQRKQVLDAVLHSTVHPSADDVYTITREANPRMSRGTVYRNLHLLSDTGRIRRITMPVGPDRYDWRLESHYHFICRGCGCVVDASVPYDDELSNLDPGLDGYAVEWHRLILVGLCPECAEKYAAAGEADCEQPVRALK